MRPSLTGLASVLLGLAALTTVGCGLKGDLYLAEEASSEPPSESAQEARSGSAEEEPEG